MEGETRLKAGYTLDRYELLCPVGSGGMASVWLARMRGKRGFEKLFAIKTIRAELSDDPQFEQMFLDEARIASGIQHANVAQVLDLGEQDGILFAVMEWVDGESLAKVRQFARKDGAKIPLGVALRIVADACAGLHGAHELRDAAGNHLGVVHRDVSPHNILISASGGVKVIDFGLATASNRLAPRTQAGLLKGKLEYMAPEQALGHDIDRRADVWAMGVCLYEMLAERLPFTADNQLDLARRITTGAPASIEGLPEPIRQILIGALARDPEERFESAATMRKRCELTISAMDLPSTSEDVAAFVETHLAERTARRADTVVRALEDAAGRAGNSTPPPVGVRVSARATLDPDAFKEAAGAHRPSSSGGLTGATEPRHVATSRRAWLLPAFLITIIVGFSAVGILKRVKATSPSGQASTPASLSVAAPSITPPSVSTPHAPVIVPDAGTVVLVPSSRTMPLATRPKVAPVEMTAPSASASAAPTATWGKIPPTVPIILPTPASDPTP